MELFNSLTDEVIKSSVSIGSISYDYALDKLVPLIDKFGEQRKIQSQKFYERLKRDILSGCVMPAITIAFVDAKLSRETNPRIIRKFVQDNITDGYILDGLQRLNTLLAAKEETNFDGRRNLPITVIIAERYDFLLYRMITLNNGQKPMTARHQIEMLTDGLFRVGSFGIEVITEKETQNKNPKGAFKKSDISESYIAFMSDNLHNQNKRIIESKLDEILVGKIMESRVFDLNVSFENIMRIVGRFSEDDVSRNWLRLGNNLIGFVVGAKESAALLNGISPKAFGRASQSFETAFESLEQSKVNVGKVRREFAREFIAKYKKYQDGDVDVLEEALHELTL